MAPEALIRFTRTNGAGAAFGDLYFRGERLMPFQEGQSQGYGSHWWSTGAEDARSNPVVVFAGTEVVRGSPMGEQAMGMTPSRADSKSQEDDAR